MRLRVLQQRLPQLLRQEYGAVFSLIGHLRPAQPNSLHSKKTQLADPDAGGTDALHHQQQPVVLPPARRRQQAAVLLFCQLLLLLPENPPLHLHRLQPAFPQPQEVKKTVQGSYGAIDPGGSPLTAQLRLVGQHQFPVRRPALQPPGKTRRLPAVFLYGGGTSLLRPQCGGKARQVFFSDFHKDPPFMEQR